MDNFAEQNSSAEQTTVGERRLTRARGSAVLGGVAAGLARYLNTDPLLVRLGFIGAALLGGAGVLLYLIAWVLIPADDEPAAAAGEGALENAIRRIQEAPPWLQILAIVFVALLIASPGAGMPGELVWAFVLVAGGVLLFRAADARTAAAQAPGPQTAPAPAADATAAAAVPPPPVSERPTAPYPTSSYLSGSTPPPPPPPPPTPKEPRPPALLARLTLAVLLLAAGVAALLEELNVVSIAPREYVAGALLIIGGALLVGSWVGRARPLIWLGVLLLPLLLLVSFPTLPIQGGVGERVHVPTSMTQLEPVYELGVGNMTVDLSQLPGRDPIEVELRMSLGELRVIVPEGANLDIDGRLRGGEAEVLGSTINGTSLDLGQLDPPETGGRRVVLDVQHLFGTVRVTDR